LMRSSGLTDRNEKERKEIFEGDILQAQDFAKHGDQEIGIVKYDGATFKAWDLSIKDFNGILENYINYDTEVIGNIYENPELVNV
jgi:uncharacterized phage protein (TIGR01671 family)